jgi:uncharacterized protein (TIGR02646 family)
MIHIKKGSPPKVLLDYKKSPYAVYSPPSDIKEIWRDTLLEEQGFLCAYTMERIEPGIISGTKNSPKVKLEHLNPQNGDKDNDLNHSNVVAVCNGNEGELPKNQYADTRKGEDLLDRRLHPTNSDIEKLIKYRPNGEIFTTIQELDAQIDDNTALTISKKRSILNLNYKNLRDGRKSTYDAVKIKLTKADWAIPAINSEIKRFESLDKNNKRLEFCGYVLYFLRKEYKLRTQRN